MLNNLPAEEFLNEKVRIIFEPMVSKLLLEKPDDPIPYMIDFLGKISGRNNSHNMEREELNNLRKEVAKLKKKYDHQEENIHSESDNDDDTEDYDEVHEMEMRKKLAAPMKAKRSSVCAEVYGNFNKKENFTPKLVEKTAEQYERITNKVNQSFMFSALDEKELRTVINAMEERFFKKDDVVIEQGESGDVLYLIESGKLDCFKKFNQDENRVFLKEYVSGEAFGELALLYNAPRAATIIAKEDCRLWSLDRETFNHIVKDASMKKRERYEKFLKSINILTSIDSYEINQISDALKIKKYNAGDYVIKQGDIGEDFFILEEGEAYASKPLEDSGEAQVVKEYQVGDYFGELALIKNDFRAANVIAKTNCILLSLDRKSFKRLLGPVENIMNRLSNDYVKYGKI